MSTDPENTNPARSQFSVSGRVALVFIILCALAIHLWGLDFGLPQALHPDEPIVVTRAQFMAATNDTNPEAFHWPSLQIYLLALEYKVDFWIGNLNGSRNYPELADKPAADRYIANTFRNPSGYYLAGRFTTVIFGLVLIWLIFLLVSRFLPPPWAIFAAILAALNPILFESGRFVTPDIPAEVFFVAALIVCDRLFVSLSAEPDEKEHRGPVSLAIIASVFAGLATGT